MGARLGIFLALVLTGCSSSAGIRVTLTFDDSVSDAALATVSQFVLHAAGDDTGDFPIPLSRAAQRTERFVYDPSHGAHDIMLSVDADNASGAVEARSGEVTVDGSSVTLVLSATSLPDGGVGDGGMGDLAGTDGMVDLAHAPDLAVAVQAPTFGATTSASNSAPVGSSTLTVASPAGTKNGTLLVAGAYAFNQTTGTPTLSPPSGWLQIGSTQSDSGHHGVAGFWYHTSMGNEGDTYSFTATGDGGNFVVLASYQGAIKNGVESATVALGSLGTNVDFAAVTNNVDASLRIGFALAPVFPTEQWTAPASTNSRSSNGALVWDEVIHAIGSQAAVSGAATDMVLPVTLSAIVSTK